MEWTDILDGYGFVKTVGGNFRRSSDDLDDRGSGLGGLERRSL